jgi:hypothetical protein
VRLNHLHRKIGVGAAVITTVTGLMVGVAASPAFADDRETYCPDGNYDWKIWLKFDWGGTNRAQYLIDSISFG